MNKGKLNDAFSYKWVKKILDWVIEDEPHVACLSYSRTGGASREYMILQYEEDIENMIDKIKEETKVQIFKISDKVDEAYGGGKMGSY